MSGTARRLRSLALVLGALVGSVLLGAALLVSTRAGAAWTLRAAAPASVSVDRVEGRLLGPLVLEGLRIRIPTATVSVSEVTVEWRPLRLFRGELRLTRIGLRGADVRRDAPADGEVGGDAQAPRLVLPLPVVLDELELEGLTLLSPSAEEELEVSAATLRARLADGVLRLDTLQVEASRTGVGRVSLGAAGRYGGRRPHPLSGRVAWTGEMADGRTLAGEGGVDGDLSRLEVEHRLTRPTTLRVEGRVRDVLGRPTWEARAVLAPTALRTLMPDAPEGRLDAVVDASGTTDSAVARVEGTVDVPGVNRIALRGRTAVTEDSVRVEGLRATFEGGGGEVRGEARARIGSEDVAGRIRIDWSDLRWPLTGEEVTARSPTGSLVVEGGPSGFDVLLDVRTAPEVLPIPISRVQVDARGSAVDGWRLDGAAGATVDDDVRIEADFSLHSNSARHELRSFRASVAGSPAAVELSGRLETGPTRRFALRGGWSGLRRPLRADSAWGSPEGRFRLEGTTEAFVGGVEGTVRGPTGPEIGLQVDLEGGLAGDTLRAEARFSGMADGWPGVEGTTRVARSPGEIRIDTLTVRVPETGGRLGLTARVAAPIGPGAPLRIRASWRDLGWPPSPVSGIRSPAGRMDLEGTLSAYRLRLEGDLVGDRIPAATVALGASGDREEIVFDSLRVETLDGRIQGGGRVVLGPSGRWSARLEGRGLDPAGYAPDWPGSLDLEVEGEGSLGDERPTARVAVTGLRGRVRDRPVDAVLRMRLEEDVVTVDTLSLRSGRSRLAAGGTVGSAWQFAWNVQAEDLADFHPAASGRLHATGRIAGPRESLGVRVRAEGEGVVFPGGSVEELALDADVDIGGRAPTTLLAELRGLAAGPLEADSIELRGTGSPEAHEVALDAFLAEDHLETGVTGGWANDRWSGTLARFDLSSERAGRWELDARVPLEVGPDRASLGDLCWGGPAGRACATGSWSRELGLEWSASSRNLPLALFTPLLPEPIDLEGALSLESRGRMPPGEPPTGEGSLRVDSGLLRYRLADGSEIERAVESFRIDAGAGGGELRADAGLRVTDLALAEGSIRTSLSGPIPERSLRARITAEVDDGGLLGAALEDLSSTGGRITVELEADGTVERPGVKGRVDVTGGGATVVPLGVRLTDVRLSARPESGEGSGWRLEGAASSGEGRLDASGSIDVLQSPFRWSLDGELTGSRFELYRTALGHVLVSPELRVRATPDRVTAEGQIVLPRARLTARRLEPPVPTSTDVVVTGGPSEPENGDGMRVPPLVSGRVSVVLGEDVGIDVLGIQGDLQGTLLITADPGRVPTASGELRILGGSYTAYRQTLQIERGRLLYANSPLDDPSLDLRITRRSGEVLSGMNVTGSARNPAVTLFSEPPLADQEILAYLITGRPLGGLSQGEGRIVESMARSVGIAGGNLVLARLGMMFGLEHARVEAGPGGTGASVVIGKQLLPRLEVDYAVGLLGAPNVVRLRYRLGRGWYLQSESGRETGADVVYVVEER